MIALRKCDSRTDIHRTPRDTFRLGPFGTSSFHSAKPREGRAAEVLFLRCASIVIVFIW